MDIKSEQHAAIRFCVHLNKTGAETVALLCEAYQEERLGRSMIRQWPHAFVKGRQSTTLIPHGQQPATATTPINVDMVSMMIKEDCHWSMRKIPVILNKMQSSVNQILCEHLGLESVSLTWVSHLLTREQMDAGLHLC